MRFKKLAMHKQMLWRIRFFSRRTAKLRMLKMPKKKRIALKLRQMPKTLHLLKPHRLLLVRQLIARQLLNSSKLNSHFKCKT